MEKRQISKDKLPDIKFEDASKHSSSAVELSQLMSFLEPTNVSQARPPILASVANSDLQNFVTSFKNYKKLGGREAARSFLHSDVIGYFLDIFSVDLNGDEFSESDAVLEFFRKQYAPRRLDYIKLLKELAMPHMDVFDKGAVANYQMRFTAYIRAHPDISKHVEEAVISDALFSGLQPKLLRTLCKEQKNYEEAAGH